MTPSAPFTGDADDWEAMLVAFPIDESGQSFELAEPLPLATHDTDIPTRLLPAPGALSQHLQTFGESLCRMSLAVENMEAARRYLDEHGVPNFPCIDSRSIVVLVPSHSTNQGLSCPGNTN